MRSATSHGHAYSRLALNTNYLSPLEIRSLRCKAKPRAASNSRRRRSSVSSFDIGHVQLGHIRTLQGHDARSSARSTHAEFDEIGFERHLERIRRLAHCRVYYWVRKLQARFFAGDSASAIEASLKARPQLLATPSYRLLSWQNMTFTAALARAACCHSRSADQRRRAFGCSRAHHGQLEIWSENCPENFANRAALVGAEIARHRRSRARCHRALRTGDPLGPGQQFRPE